MKKLLLLTLLSLEIFAAPSGVYVELGAGLPLEDSLKGKGVNLSYDKDYIGNLAIGYQLDLYRFELEGKYQKSKLESSLGHVASGDITQDSQMLNAYYSGYNESKLVSSIGIGAGITNIKTTNLKELGVSQTDIKSETIPSLQGMLSVGYQNTPNFITTLKYSYFYMFKSDEFDASASNIFSLTFRYIF
jgi:opacity protein-like surface antigen